MKREIKRELIELTSLIIILGVILVATNVIYFNKITIKRFQQENTSEYLKEGNLRVAFFGSSHTQYDVSPLYIPYSYNFGLAQYNYITAYNRLKEIYESNFSIDIVVIELDLVMYAKGLRGDIAPQLTIKRESSLNKSIRKLTLFNYCMPINNSTKLRECMPVIGNGLHLFFINKKDEKSKNYTKINTLGWYPSTGNFSNIGLDNRKRSAIKRLGYHFSDMINLDSLPYLIKMINLTRNKSVLVLVIYPVTREYDEAL